MYGIVVNFYYICFITILIHINAEQLQSCNQLIINNSSVLLQLDIYNLMVFVDPNDLNISRQLRNQKIFNERIIKILTQYIQQNQDIIHVGAHTGIQSLVMAKHIRQKSYQNITIHALQPNQLYYILLIKSAFINNFQDLLLVYRAAAYFQEGIAQIAIRNIDTSSAQILANAKTQRKSDYKYNVKTVSLDNFCYNKTYSFNRNIGIVYISANTMEIQVLMGMKQIIQRNKDRLVIIFDWHFGKNVHKNVDGFINIANQLERYQYTLYQIDLQKQVFFIKMDNLMQLIQRKQGKFILIPKNKSKLDF